MSIDKRYGLADAMANHAKTLLFDAGFFELPLEVQEWCAEQNPNAHRQMIAKRAETALRTPLNWSKVSIAVLDDIFFNVPISVQDWALEQACKTFKLALADRRATPYDLLVEAVDTMRTSRLYQNPWETEQVYLTRLLFFVTNLPDEIWTLLPTACVQWAHGQCREFDNDPEWLFEPPDGFTDGYKRGREFATVEYRPNGRIGFRT